MGLGYYNAKPTLAGRFYLLLEFQSILEFFECFRILPFQVFEEAAAFIDFFEQPTAAGVVLLVSLQVFSEELYFLGEDRDLHLRRPGIRCMGAEFFNKLLLLLNAEHRFTNERSSNRVAGLNPSPRNRRKLRGENSKRWGRMQGLGMARKG